MAAKIENRMERGPRAAPDRRMAVLTSTIVFLTLVVWTVSGGPGAQIDLSTPIQNPTKWIVYTLPLTLGLGYYVTFDYEQMRIDSRSAAAFTIYCLCAMTSMVANSWLSFFAVRDCAIISGYLLLFVFWFRAPPSLADVALLILTVCLAIEASSRLGSDISFWNDDGLIGFLGLSNSFGISLFGSHGVLESALGFPIGVVLLYYLHNRKWWRVLLAGVLLFMTFKRITFTGILLAVVFELGLAGVKSRSTRRLLALLIVVALSITAIFSTQLFETAADSLALPDSDATGVSVGRYDLAVMLWNQLKAAEIANWIFGFGPGAADAWVTRYFRLGNPHNDWLKILFDYGTVGFLGLHAVLFLTLTRHRLGTMIYLYTATLMMTDNVFIYMFHQVFVAMMMCTGRSEREYSASTRARCVPPTS